MAQKNIQTYNIIDVKFPAKHDPAVIEKNFKNRGNTVRFKNFK